MPSPKSLSLSTSEVIISASFTDFRFLEFVEGAMVSYASCRVFFKAVKFILQFQCSIVIRNLGAKNLLAFLG
jgi:hypothetical protein